MDFAPRIGGDDLVHETEELDAPAFLVVTADNRAARKIERGEQRRRPVPFVIMRLAGHGAPVRQFEITLRALQRTRHFDAVPVVQPSARPIARVGAPSAAINTICAFMRVRCSVLVARAKPSSSARSSSVNVIGVACERLLMQP